VLTGLPSADEDPPAGPDIVLGELSVHGVFGASSTAWQHAVRAFAAGALNPALLITDEISLDDVPEAFRVLREDRERAVKVLLRP
jgi:threonine dehydrogenase-like Zn-dependent dehydrogenase